MSSLRILAVIRTLERVMHRSDWPDAPAAAADHINTIEAQVEQLAALLHPVSAAKLLVGRELWASLASAVVSIARDRRSCRLAAKDLADLVQEHCPEQDLAFWAGTFMRPPQIMGLLRVAMQLKNPSRPEEGTELPELRKMIETEGVIFWREDADPAEEQRLVDTRWLDAHADIRRWVTDPWPGGRRCRFCGLIENHRVNALLSVNPERRNGMQMIGDTVVLQVGSALTHDRCRDRWVEWTAIAARYATQEAAQAGDKAAGRKSRYEQVQASARTLEAPK